MRRLILMFLVVIIMVFFTSCGMDKEGTESIKHQVDSVISLVEETAKANRLAQVDNSDEEMIRSINRYTSRNEAWKAFEAILEEKGHVTMEDTHNVWFDEEYRDLWDCYSLAELDEKITINKAIH